MKALLLPPGSDSVLECRCLSIVCELLPTYLLYIQALIETHDDVASKNYEVVPPEAYPLITGESIIPQSISSIPYSSAQNLNQDAVRMVGIRKNPEESLVTLFSVSFSRLYFNTCYVSLQFSLN